MKNLRFITALTLIVTIAFVGCKKDEEQTPASTSILPSQFSIDIPSALSENVINANKADTLQGNAIYEHLRTFIYVGEQAGQMVGSIITAIAVHRINHAMSLSYQSNEDGRTKNLNVIEGATFEGKNYEFKLTITDALSESNADGGKALQVFWNRNPIDGIAIIKPSNCNREDDGVLADALFRIDYSEAGLNGYTKEMTVSIVDLPMPNALQDRYAIDNLKMFVGEKDGVIDVFGNSNHPNANLFTSQTGFNWAFVASCKRSENIAVAEVGLPSNTLNTSSRDVILVQNSIKNVFTAQINATWPGIDPIVLNAYLSNTEAPGYFTNRGFVAAGIAPSNSYNVLENHISGMTPYNPSEINGLTLSFD